MFISKHCFIFLTLPLTLSLAHSQPTHTRRLRAVAGAAGAAAGPQRHQLGVHRRVSQAAARPRAGVHPAGGLSRGPERGAGEVRLQLQYVFMYLLLCRWRSAAMATTYIITQVAVIVSH